MVAAPLLTSILGRNVQHHAAASLPLGQRASSILDKKILVLPEIKPDYTTHNLAHTMDWQSAKQGWQRARYTDYREPSVHI